MQCSTRPRSALTPSTCPSVRRLPRCLAHRPLPSMLTPRWRGILRPAPGSAITLAAGSPAINALPASGSAGRSDLHDLLFLLRHNLVDLDDSVVRGLLHEIGLLLGVVLAHVAVLF